MVGKLRGTRMFAGITKFLGKILQADSSTVSATGNGTTAGAGTLSKEAGVVTSEALTTAGLAIYVLTLTNTKVISAARTMVLATVENGTNTQGSPVIERITAGAGSVTIAVRNSHATEALNGTIKIKFALLHFS